jgi:hypothetical protein
MVPDPVADEVLDHLRFAWRRAQARPPPLVLSGHASSLPPVLSGHASSLPPVLTGHGAAPRRARAPSLPRSAPYLCGASPPQDRMGQAAPCFLRLFRVKELHL